MGRETETDDETLDTEREAGVGEGGSERSEDELEGREAKGEKETDEDRDADETGESGSKKSGFEKRIAKLSAQRREATRERDALAARVAAYEKKERDAAAAADAAKRRTPEGLKLEERRQAVRNTIDETYGPGTSDILEEQRQERQLQKEQYAMNGITFLKAELEDHGLKVDDKMLVRWEHAVGSELAEDPQLLAAFKRPATQKAAIEEAVNRVRDGLVNETNRQLGGKMLERIERNRNAVLGGRTPAGAAESQPLPDNYVAKPPKNATPAQLEEFWSNHRDQLWKKLQAGADA